MIRRRSAAALAVGMGALGLVGCAAVLSTPAPTLRGRLSLRIAANNAQPERGLNASFDLLGTADRGELRLSTLFGPRIATAQWAPGGATLLTTEGEQRFDSLDALARQVLGEPVPLHALPDWLRGRPWSGAPSRPAHESFEQLGWLIDLARQAEGFVTASRSPQSGLPAVVLRIRQESR